MSLAPPSLQRHSALTDDALLRAAGAGDLSALGELYDRHAKSMWRAVRRTLGTETDAVNIVHTAFLRLPKIARSYDGRADARPWLVGIAVRAALRHMRGGRRFVQMLSGVSQSLAREAANDPEARVSGRQELPEFESAFSKLSPKKRAVFALVEIEGWTTEEAAIALGVPWATVRTRLHHARRELHSAMTRRGD